MKKFLCIVANPGFPNTNANQYAISDFDLKADAEALASSYALNGLTVYVAKQVTQVSLAPPVLSPIN